MEWTRLIMDRVIVRLQPTDLFSPARPFKRSGRPVFIAFRFTAPNSLTLRSQLERELRRYRNSRSIVLTDGRVPGGEDWAKEIRRRINSSWFGVADVTGPNREVSFELGLLAGFGKFVIPIVEASSWIGRLPRWVSAQQALSYETADDLAAIAQQILARGNMPKSADRRIASAEPTQTTVLLPEQSSIKSEHIQSIWRERSLADPLVIRHIDEIQSVDRLRVVQRSAMVLWLAGDPDLDLLGNYLAGVIAARPLAGHSGRFARQVHVMPDSDLLGLVSDAARREDSIVSVVRGTDRMGAIATIAADFSARYFRWLRGVEDRLPTFDLGDDQQDEQ